MRQIEWYIETNIVGSTVSGVTEVEDDMTDEEIEEQVKEEVFQYINWGWNPK